MTFSPLTSRVIPHRGKYSSRNGAPIIRLIAHHWASIAGGEERMQNPDAKVSCNYLIRSSGELVGQVPEEYRAWTSGSPEADGPSITVEIQNSGGAVNDDDDDPNSWPITNAAFATLCALLADLYVRYEWSDLSLARLRGHREFSRTACPGGYTWHRRQLILIGAANLVAGTPGTNNEGHAMATSAMSFTRAADGKGVVIVGDTESGFTLEYVMTDGKFDSAINNAIAGTFKTGPFANVPEYIANAFRDSLAKVRNS